MKTATLVGNARDPRPVLPAGNGADGGPGGSSRLAKLPIVLIALLFAAVLLPRVQQDVHIVQAFIGTAAVLLVWQVVLWIVARRSERGFI